MKTDTDYVDDRKTAFLDLLAGKRAALFDFDGVIADSEYYHFVSFNEVFQRRHGHTLNADEYWIHWTSRGEGAAGEAKRHGLKDVDPVAIREEKDRIYFDHCRSGRIPLFNGAVDLMRALEQRGLTTAIASNSKRAWIEAILETNGVTYRPGFVVGKTNDLKGKPAPDIFIEAARVVKEPPESCLVFEDAEKGLKAAHAAGMSCIIIRNTLNRDIAFPEADLVVPSLEELLKLLA